MNARGTTLPRLAALAIVAAALTAAPGIVAAQAAEEDGFAISRVDVSTHPQIAVEVSVPSSLTGGAVEPTSITLSENGEVLPVDVVPVPTDGLEVVLLIDTSGSMRENAAMEAAKAAAAGFLDVLPAEVAVGIVAFADTPALVSPLTTDRGLLAAALSGLTARGETALYDGIVFARSLFSGGTSDRQFVLLSDGGDTVSASSLDDAVAVAGEIRTSAIELITSESNQQSLVQLSDASNGQLISVFDPSALGALYQDVAGSLVNRYRLSFTSSAGGPTDYTVEVTTPAGVLSASTSIDVPISETTVVPTTTLPAVAAASSTPVNVAGEAVGVAAATSSGNQAGGSSALLLIGGAAVFLAICGLLIAVWPADGARRAGRRQLGVADRTRAGAPRTSVGERLSMFADTALERRGQKGRLADALDVASVSMRPGEFVVATVAFAIFGAVLVFALTGPIGALVVVIATPLVARAVLRVRAARRRHAFDEQLADVLQLITSALRSGYALPQALDAVARQAAEPARSEFARVMFETRVGRDLGESLGASVERMRSEPFGWVVSAIEINREVGGELAQVLTTVADTIRERQQLQRQVQTLTAEGRMSAYVLTALPIVVVGALALINPDYFEPMKSSPGPAIVAGALILMAIGWIWMQRLIKTEL